MGVKEAPACYLCMATSTMVDPGEAPLAKPARSSWLSKDLPDIADQDQGDGDGAACVSPTVLKMPARPKSASKKRAPSAPVDRKCAPCSPRAKRMSAPPPPVSTKPKPPSPVDEPPVPALQVKPESPNDCKSKEVTANGGQDESSSTQTPGPHVYDRLAGGDTPYEMRYDVVDVPYDALKETEVETPYDELAAKDDSGQQNHWESVYDDPEACEESVYDVPQNAVNKRLDNSSTLDNDYMYHLPQTDVRPLPSPSEQQNEIYADADEIRPDSPAKEPSRSEPDLTTIHDEEGLYDLPYQFDGKQEECAKECGNDGENTKASPANGMGGGEGGLNCDSNRSLKMQNPSDGDTDAAISSSAGDTNDHTEDVAARTDVRSSVTSCASLDSLDEFHENTEYADAYFEWEHADHWIRTFLGWDAPFDIDQYLQTNQVVSLEDG